MKALQFTKAGLNLASVAIPNLAGETLVRVVKSGICNTDIEIARGYAGFYGTLGHEFVGVVEESADEPTRVGQRVVGEINAGCGICGVCVTGDSRHCVERTVLGIVGRDGCHAEFLILPSRNLLNVPDNVSDEDAVFAEPLAAACGIVERTEIDASTSVAVIGDGKLGLLSAFCLAQKTSNIILVGKHESKLELARTRQIEGILLMQAQTMDRKFDVVVEASGSDSGFELALDLVKPKGKIVLKSTFSGAAHWPASRVVVDEITIVGSRCGRLAPALDLLSNGGVKVSDLISDEFSLADGLSAMKRAEQGGVLKVLLSMT